LTKYNNDLIYHPSTCKAQSGAVCTCDEFMALLAAINKYKTSRELKAACGIATMDGEEEYKVG